VLLVVLFFTTIVTDMPKAVLGAIVVLIGIDLVDITGLRRIARRRRSEFVIAVVTVVVVCAVGIEQGIVLAIVVSILEVVRRQYQPNDFVLTVSDTGLETYRPATAGPHSEPGLIIFRYDAELLYATSNRFVDVVEGVIDHAPDPVRRLVLDAGSIDDIDYSAGIALGGLVDFLETRRITFAIIRADPWLLDTMRAYDLLDRIGTHRYDTLDDAIEAFRSDAAPTS